MLDGDPRAALVDQYERERQARESGWPGCGPYCTHCGDCLACYGGDPCYDGGSHGWPAEEERDA